MSETKKTLREELTERAERMFLSGEVPGWMELQSYDLAKVRLPGGHEDAYLVVASPPRAAKNDLDIARSRLEAFQQRHAGNPPKNDAEEEKLEKDIRRLLEQTERAEARYLSASIREVGPGVVFRSDVGAYRDGDTIPAPRDIADEAVRRQVLFEGFPDIALVRAHTALSLMAARIHSLGGDEGNG